MRINKIDKARENLENYIEENLAKGYSIESIKTVLINSGLESPFVNEIVKDYQSVEKPKAEAKEARDELGRYIKEGMSKGYSLKNIKTALVKSGLKKDFANKLLQEYFVKNYLFKPVFIITFVLLVFSLLLLQLPPLGKVPELPPEALIVENTYVDIINLSLNYSGEYNWTLSNKGILKAIELAGSISKRGYAEIYLEYNNTLYLIFNSSKLSKEERGITGLVVGDINHSSLNEGNEEINDVEEEGELLINNLLKNKTINESVINVSLNNILINNSITNRLLNNKTTENKFSEINLTSLNKSIIITTQGGGSKAVDDVFKFNISGKFNWDVNYDKLCSRWSVNLEWVECYGADDCCNFLEMESIGLWNNSFYLSYGRYNSGFENIVSAQLIYYDVNLSIPYADIVYSDITQLEANFFEGRISFRNIVILPEFNASSYRVVFIIENASLSLDNIGYTIKERIYISRNPPRLIANISNITIYKDEKIKLNLSRYFYDEDRDNLTYKVYKADNITLIIEDSVVKIIPDYNFTGKRFMFVAVFDGYYNATSNIFSVDIIEKPLLMKEVNITEEIIKPKVVINQPVRWVKKVNASASVINLSTNISSDALNVTVRDVKEDRIISEDKLKVNDKGVIKNASAYRVEKRIKQIEKSGSRLEDKKIETIRERPTDKEEISSINKELLELQNEMNKLTGYIIVDKEKKGILTRFFEWLFNIEVTGYAIYGPIENETNASSIVDVITENATNASSMVNVSAENETNVTTVIIEDIVEEIEIEYYTEGPISEEKNISKGKRIIVSSDIHYENIVAYTNISPEAPSYAIKLYRIINESRELVDNVSHYDKNNNSLVDYIEWIIPSLSNETYEVIIITKAVHLDSNRNLIADIYEHVKTLDGNWSPAISSGEYLRVTFEKPLNKTKDITIYARSNNSNSSSEIEVYRENDNNLIVKFENISDENWYKVYLTNLSENESYDVFDLKIIGNETSVEFDYIVDPQPRDFTLSCTVKASCTAPEVDVFHMSGLSNAHAEIRTGTGYTNRVCCDETNDGTATLDTQCSGNFVNILDLSATTNAHVEVPDGATGYNNYVCLSTNVPSGNSPLSVQYTTLACGTNSVCVATISVEETGGDTNLHVADCVTNPPYTTKVCVTLGDIINNPPNAPVLIQPEVDECISGPAVCDLFDRNVEFSWSGGTDPDGDPVTFKLILTGPNANTYNSVTSPYTVPDVLNVEVTHTWQVESCDPYSACTSSGTRNFKIPRVIDISLISSSIDFETVTHLEEKHTDPGPPSPFIVQNNGNDNTDIKIYGPDLWSITTSATQENFFKSKEGGMVEANSYTIGSQPSYTGIKDDGTGLVVLNDLKWKDTEDSAEIDIWIQVPQSEPTGSGKTTTVTVKGEYIP